MLGRNASLSRRPFQNDPRHRRQSAFPSYMSPGGYQSYNMGGGAQRNQPVDPLQMRLLQEQLARMNNNNNNNNYNTYSPGPYARQSGIPSGYASSLSLPTQYTPLYPQIIPQYNPMSSYYNTHPNGRCLNGCSLCSGGGNDGSGSSRNRTFKTKDISIRGKARAVRASYLTEAPKFEADLVKYLEKKKDDVIPDRVIDMLVKFINCENYDNEDPLDEITLNILASNVGAKSAMDFSLGRLRKFACDVRTEELVPIVATILMSSKVDKGLKEWLKKILRTGNRVHALETSIIWNRMVDERPELRTEMLRLVGKIPEAQDEGFRTL